MRLRLGFLAWCAALALPAGAQNPYIQRPIPSPLPGGYVGAYSNFFRAVTYNGSPAAKVGSSFSVTLQPSGGKPSYHWSIVSGTAPAGLSLNPSTGAVSG